MPREDEGRDGKGGARFGEDLLVATDRVPPTMLPSVPGPSSGSASL